MFLQEKIQDINRRLKELRKTHNIIIWGAGRHTAKLFELTDMLSYDIKNIIDIDRKKQGSPFFGFRICGQEKVEWNRIEAVVLSVPGKEKQIIDTLVDTIKFEGKIIVLYEKQEITPFYLLSDERISEICCLGDYTEWSDAYAECQGYEDKDILTTVISTTEKVQKGDAVWEREGTLFYEPKYVYPICAAILKCAVQNNNRGVRVLDIGGSLGSTYFQNRQYLQDVNNLEYIVAEQEGFAKYGHENLENGILKFVQSTDQWEDFDRFDIILMSGSLQYIGEYKKILSRIEKSKPRYIIIDRLLVSNRMRICRQVIPGFVSEKSWSYPIRIFGEDDVLSLFQFQYKLIEKDFSSIPEEAYFTDGRADAKWYVFENKTIKSNK